MTGKDPDLHPRTVFLVMYTGGQALVVAHSTMEATKFMRRVLRYPTGPMSVRDISPEDEYMCIQNGVEKHRATHPKPVADLSDTYKDAVRTS